VTALIAVVVLVALGPLVATPLVFVPRSVRGATLIRGHGAQRPEAVRTPAAGSATRTALLDAVRKQVGVRSRFKVSHVRSTDRWAFVRCVEVVDDGGALQETDLDIAALLERRGTGAEAR